MKAFGALAALVLVFAAGRTWAAGEDLARLRQEAARVTIVRDDWGIAHVSGPTDADAVFGMVYAQAEDDFGRVEANYIDALGLRAEAAGEGAIWQDLRQRLFVDPDDLKARYARSPPWLKSLMEAWADGLNWYLATHPGVKPRVIRYFEPWMALSFTEGSIGGDIESISLKDLAAFYGRPGAAEIAPPTPVELADMDEVRASNGIAIAPSNTRDRHALLLINPHTSFYFRSELQMTSGQGLNAYGAATWGQFFIYQGFNEHIGWMHTSTGLDAIDEFAETIVRRGGRLFYRYGAELRPVAVSTIVVPYRAASGAMASRAFTVYRTHHGPIVREAGGKWIAVALMNKPIAALEQSYLRTKAVDYASYLRVAELKANSSNNTVFADDKGEIAFLMPQFVPRRDDRFDYTHPVDGSNPATDWKGLHALDELPHVLNPPNGWILNTNDWPYSAAGPYSPRRADYPRYMDTAGEDTRGVHAALLLAGRKDFTLRGLNRAAFDSYLPAFARLVPSLVKAYDATPSSDPLKAKLKEQVAILAAWDDRWGYDSVATSLAVLWGNRLLSLSEAHAHAAGVPLASLENIDWMAERTTPAQKLEALAGASDELEQDFGTWRTPWGQINRFQRLNDDITPVFSDDRPSLAIPFTWSEWGSLASSKARRYPGTKKYYGSSGNSFVAVVEFGPRVRAVAVTAGGESGHPGSPHFDDEAQRYATGNLREVYFYPDQLKAHTERRYHPGE